MKEKERREKEGKKKGKSLEKRDKITSLLKKATSRIIPQGGEKIIDILYKKNNVNEFLISKELELTINQTRNILYKLLDASLVKFIRKKDKKKGGWYTYFWTLSTKKSLILLKEKLESEIKEFEENSLKRKNERFYFSPGANIEYSEDEALENNFVCPETGEVLELKDNSEIVSQLDIGLSKLKILIIELTEEIEEIEKKEIIQKERKDRLEKKKKEEERKRKREIQKEKREKEAKKKKPSKKVQQKTKDKDKDKKLKIKKFLKKSLKKIKKKVKKSKTKK